jgi:hypothetical protein
MANVNHSSLTDPLIHEPKGVASANANEVYVANGSGSGTWKDHRRSVFTLHFADISTASNMYFPIPFGGTVSRVTSVLEDSIAGSDLVVTVKNSSSASMGTITVTQSGSAAGDIDFLNPSSNNTVADNDYILVQTNGGPTSHVDFMISVVVEHV